MKSLLERFPRLERLSPLPLAELPTPLDVARGLTDALATTVLVKHDERTAPLYGGNKVRKLELLLGSASGRGARTIVTAGAIGSHHVLATTLYARRLGIHVEAVVVEQPVTPHVRSNLRAILAAGARLVPVPSYGAVAVAMLALAARAALRDRVRPALIWPGGSSPLGTIGYVDAALELAAQVRQGIVPEPDHIFVALGSGGTTAGLLVGLRLVGLKAELHGVVVVDMPLGVRPLAASTLRRLRAIDPTVPKVALGGLDIDRSELGAGYGHETQSGQAALELARSTEGLIVEPTYTAKALAALVRRARGDLRGKTLLYWHTLSAVSGDELALPELDVSAVPHSLRAACALA